MKDTHLSENQEDKLVSLRTLQECLYTTAWSPLTNYLSKCEWLFRWRVVSINSLIYCADWGYVRDND